MHAEDFSHVTTWVFDLDNTLYPPEIRLFDQIEVRMTAFVMQALNVGRAEADRLRQHYWQTYGTTLAGLMDEHGVDPGPYLTDVHQIDFTVLPAAPDLASALADLPGRKVIYTNGTATYAEKVAHARGIVDEFDAIYGVENAQFRPKPERQAFDAIVALDGFDPAKATMFEDEARNLKAPKDLGMRTVHVAQSAVPMDHIDHHTDDLTRFLGLVLASERIAE